MELKEGSSRVQFFSASFSVVSPYKSTEGKPATEDARQSPLALLCSPAPLLDACMFCWDRLVWACFMEEVHFGNETLKGSVHSCCFWRGGSSVNRRNDERKRSLKGIRVKDELTDRMKESGKGKVSISCYCIPSTTKKIFSSLVLFTWFHFI